MPSLHEDPVTFIDNAEDRIVVECDADWIENKFGHLDVWQDGLFAHMSMPVNWTVEKTEYTGEVYRVTISRLWV